MSVRGSVVLVFFFGQKTAYEMLWGLVGSEMCVRVWFGLVCVNLGWFGLVWVGLGRSGLVWLAWVGLGGSGWVWVGRGWCGLCRLYTSDAAGE